MLERLDAVLRGSLLSTQLLEISFVVHYIVSSDLYERLKMLFKFCCKSNFDENL